MFSNSKDDIEVTSTMMDEYDQAEVAASIKVTKDEAN